MYIISPFKIYECACFSADYCADKYDADANPASIVHGLEVECLYFDLDEGRSKCFSIDFFYSRPLQNHHD